MTKSKDPAALFYISDWLTSTAEMDADCRGWYLNLILHQYDKGDLPNDIEKLALLASVKFSEYERFKQAFEQVLKQKFKPNDKNRLENEKAKSIIKKREQFKDKRSNSGRIGYLVKVAYTITKDNDEIEYIKSNFNFDDNPTNDKQVLKQVLKQMIKLYRNRNENETKLNIEFETFWNMYSKKEGDKKSCISKWNKLKDEERQKIIDTLPNFLSSIRDKQYQPYPTSYLNQRRWEDEIKSTKLNLL